MRELKFVLFFLEQLFDRRPTILVRRRCMSLRLRPEFELEITRSKSGDAVLAQGSEKLLQFVDGVDDHCLRSQMTKRETVLSARTKISRSIRRSACVRWL